MNGSFLLGSVVAGLCPFTTESWSTIATGFFAVFQAIALLVQ
jgi:hypothetical protein